jgi:hypothetical protein
VDEARLGVVMRRKNRIGPDLMEHVKILRIAVPIEKDDMMRIDRPNGLVKTAIEWLNQLARGITRLIHWIVARHPGMVTIVTGKCLPEMDRPVLEMAMLPEQCLMRRIIAMPVLVLVTRQSVQIENGINPLLRTEIDYAVQMLETLFFDDKGFHI